MLRGQVMSFIGVISNKKSFENIKKKLTELNSNISIIHINLKSVSNIKNIKFEVIIIDDKISKFCNYEECLKKICLESKYLIVNTDMK